MDEPAHYFHTDHTKDDTGRKKQFLRHVNKGTPLYCKPYEESGILRFRFDAINQFPEIPDQLKGSTPFNPIFG
jgi:hypothetical protein